MQAPTSITATGRESSPRTTRCRRSSEALRLYDVRWLALEGSHTVEALGRYCVVRLHPEWLSDPIVVTPPLPRIDEEIAKQAMGSRPRVRPCTRCASSPTTRGAQR